MDGVVIVKKEAGLSSQAVVNRVKRLYAVDRAGHTGTLDPLAEGVLPVLIGRAVKASEFMLTEDKHYRATLLLGLTTDTEDITGETLTRTDTLPTPAELLAVIPEFVGKIKQIPPMYSALKRGGQKLCDLARRGIEVEREAREIEIYSLTAEHISGGEYTLDVHCSKGTYIRTLCADIGKRLGSGGVMKTLCRTAASGFTLGDAHTLGELEAMSEAERGAIVIPTERIFEKFTVVALPPFFSHLARAGQEIYLRKIGRDFPLGTLLRLSDERGFFAVGEVREYEAGAAIKPIRQFRLD